MTAVVSGKQLLWDGRGEEGGFWEFSLVPRVAKFT